jgi:hydrogenase expression/formation protein HypC
MCLAMPVQVVSVDVSTDMAKVSLGGILKEVSLALVDDVAVGDYLLIHVGFALNKLDEDEAIKTLKIFAELARLHAME